VLVLRLSYRLDQHLHRCANQLPVLPQRDAVLRLHDRIPPLLGDLCRHRSVERRRLRPRLGRVREDADVVEFLLFDEGQEAPELVIRLARVADDERCPHHQTRQRRAGMVD